MQRFNWQFWLSNCVLLLLLLINAHCSTHADVVNADGCFDAADNAQTQQQYQLLGMADVPLVPPTPHDEIVRSQRSLFKKLFKNFGLEDLFDDDGQSLCVNCCNNNNNNNNGNYNGGEYNEDNAYSDAEPAQPAPPFDPLYSPFQPFVPMQPLPPFGALPPLPQPFSLLRPIIGGITGNRGNNVAGPQPLLPPLAPLPPPPPMPMPLPPAYKEPTAVSYDEVGDSYAPKSPPSLYEAPISSPPPAPVVNYGNEPAPISVGAAKGAAPQVIYQPIIFVSPPLKSSCNQKECASPDPYELPLSTPAPPTNSYIPSYRTASPPPTTNNYSPSYTPSPPPSPPTDGYITPYTPPPSEQLYIETTDAPPPLQSPPLPAADPYAVPTLPPYASNARTVDYQNQYTPSNVADAGYAQTYATAPPTGSMLQPYGGITSISATYTIVAPYKAPSTPQPPPVEYQPQKTLLPCHMQPVQLTLADQPYRDCPELFSNYQRNLNSMPIVN